MAQSDNVITAQVDSGKVTLSGIHFHDMQTSTPSGNPAPAGKLDLSSVLAGPRPDRVVPTVPPPADTRGQLPAARPQQADTHLPPMQVTAPDRIATTTVARPAASSDDQKVARPDPEESTGAQVGNLFSNGAAIGASVLAASKLKGALRSDEISKITQLSETTNPATLEALREQADEVTRLVAAKSKEAALDVEKLAGAKPDAFQEITELMPAKGPGLPPQQLVYHQPKPPRQLTQDELSLPPEQQGILKDNMTLTDEEMGQSIRADYLRGLERRVVKDFNIGNTSTVSAFRTRKPYIDGLAKEPFAVEEGLASPLNKLESLSDEVMEQTTMGRLGLHKTATREIYAGLGMLAGSYVATRGIDHFLYGGKSQGFLTTAFDCAAPFLVLTKMSPVAKIGLMIGGHELVRGIEYMSNKNKDK